MARFELRLADEELVRWRRAAGSGGVARWVRGLAARELDGAGSGAGASSGVVSVDVGLCELSRYDRDCTNAGSHWRGACRFCGGGR